ncbi:MAG TPA: COX15/CtaA family protein [Microthrixaceae bacterium]|nr:COX15/CtaA family protein [Microthrixaceae bacterium]
MSPVVGQLDEGVERFTISARGYRSIAIISLALIAVIIVIGAAVRLTGSGLGCADWPNCEAGGGKFVEFGSTSQTIEQANRLLSGIGGIVAATIAVVGARRLRPYRRELYWLSLGLVAGVFGNIPLGGITVLLDLHPAAVASHFVLGMILLSNAVVLVWRASNPAGPREVTVGRVELNLSRIAVMSASALMLTGPLVTGSGPHAGDASARRFGFSVPDVARVHSINMWIFLVVAVILLTKMALSSPTPGAMRRGYAMLAAIVVQGTIGYAQYEMGIPAWLVILHVAGAATVVSTTVWFHMGLSATASPAATDALKPVDVKAMTGTTT